MVRDEIGERFALAFEEMEMSTSGGNTILTGKVVDQPHLHGILDREFFSTRPRVTLEPS